MEVNFADGIYNIDPNESTFGSLLQTEKINTGKTPKVNLPYSMYKLAKIFSKCGELGGISNNVYAMYYCIGTVTYNEMANEIYKEGKIYVTYENCINCINRTLDSVREIECEKKDKIKKDIKSYKPDNNKPKNHFKVYGDDYVTEDTVYVSITLYKLNFNLTDEDIKILKSDIKILIQKLDIFFCFKVVDLFFINDINSVFAVLNNFIGFDNVFYRCIAKD